MSEKFFAFRQINWEEQNGLTFGEISKLLVQFGNSEKIEERNRFILDLTPEQIDFFKKIINQEKIEKADKEEEKNKDVELKSGNDLFTDEAPRKKPFAYLEIKFRSDINAIKNTLNRLFLKDGSFEGKEHCYSLERHWNQGDESIRFYMVLGRGDLKPYRLRKIILSNFKHLADNISDISGRLCEEDEKSELYKFIKSKKTNILGYSPEWENLSLRWRITNLIKIWYSDDPETLPTYGYQ